MSTYVIAEVGSCHEADHDMMLAAIRAAAHAGANAVKFQWTSDPLEMARRRGLALEDGYDVVYRRYLAWEEEYHAILSDHCDEHGVDYMCTVYLPQDVEKISPYISSFKVSSFESRDADFIRENLRHAKRPHIPLSEIERQVYVSFGMSGDDDIAHFAQVTHKQKLSPMYCVSAYPTPINQLDLVALRTSAFGGRLYSGFSDHTAPEYTWTGALGVAAGAAVVEAHFKLPTTLPDNPDAPHAMSAAQFEAYAKHIRFADSCLSSTAAFHGDKPCERPMRRYLVDGS